MSKPKTVSEIRRYVKRDHRSTKIKKGDDVKVISGNDKGKTGKVLSTSGVRVLVQGVNVRKRHMKGQGQQPGRILELEKPIHISNVRVCVEKDKAVQLKVKEDGKGSRQLVYSIDNQEVVYRTLGRVKK